MSGINNFKAKFTLKENAIPIFFKAHRVPFRLIPLVNNELQMLESKNVIEKMDTSDYATPIVPILKKNNTVRVCGDFSITINSLLITMIIVYLQRMNFWLT